MKDGRKRLTKTCGAKNRRGLPCQCKLLLKGGKCKFHGGMSTGPKTPEGKARSLAALKEGYSRWLADCRALDGILSTVSPKPCLPSPARAHVSRATEADQPLS